MPSVGPHMWIVAKRVIGSGCRLGGEWVGLGMGVLDFGGDRRRGRGSLGVNTMQKWRIDRLSTRM